MTNTARSGHSQTQVMANQLAQVRINHFFRPMKDGSAPDKICEIVLLTATPNYTMTQAGTIVHEYVIEPLRFEVPDKDFDKFIANLQELRNASADELTTNPE